MSLNWEYRKLGDLCKTSSGGTPLKNRKDFYEGGTIPWLRSGEVNNRNIVDCEIRITEAGLKGSSAKLFPPRTVLIAMYGATAGQVGILNFECSTNQAVCGIYPNDKFIPEFLYYKFLEGYTKLVSLATGGAQPNISQEKIKNTIIPIIPLQEQKQIVAILDEAFEAIDQAKANIEKNIQNAKELFQSKLNDIFSQKGDGWEEKKLGDICKNLDSRRKPITKGKRTPGEIPYYGASGIVDFVEGYLFDEDLLLVSEDGANLLARTYPIAFSISGKTWVNNHAHVLKFDNSINQQFVEIYLNSIKLDDFISGMAQPKLNQNKLNSIPIPYPPIEIQETIVELVQSLTENTEELISKYNIKKESLDELKKSMLQKAFAGELTSASSVNSTKSVTS